MTNLNIPSLLQQRLKGTGDLATNTFSMGQQVFDQQLAPILESFQNI